MAFYVKANIKVVKYLRLEKERYPVKDGNYLLWQVDMLPFGSLVDLMGICRRIGAVALTPHEARMEQDGRLATPLPTATDPRFVMAEEEIEEQRMQHGAAKDEQPEPETEPETGTETETETENTPEP